MANLHDCLSELLGFEGATPPTFLSVLRSCAAQPGVPMMRDVVEAYLQAIATRVGL